MTMKQGFTKNRPNFEVHFQKDRGTLLLCKKVSFICPLVEYCCELFSYAQNVVVVRLVWVLVSNGSSSNNTALYYLLFHLSTRLIYIIARRFRTHIRRCRPSRLGAATATTTTTTRRRRYEGTKRALGCSNSYRYYCLRSIGTV